MALQVQRLYGGRGYSSLFWFAVQFLSKHLMTNKSLPEIRIVKVDVPRMPTCGQL